MFITSRRLFGAAAMMAAIGVLSNVLVAQEKPTYKIGYVGPITGPNTSVGVGTMNSIDLAIRQANARGDLPFKLEFISETDDSKPAAGVAAIQKICSDKSVLAVSAHWNSPVAMATGPYLDSCGMLNLISGAAANGITKQGWKGVGRVNSPFRYVFPELAKVAYADLGLRKIAIVHSLDDYGNETAKEFSEEFTKLGGQIVFRDGYNVGDRDFTSLLTKVRSSRPEAVLHGGVSTEAALIVRQMRQLGMKQPYLGHSGFQTVAYVQAVGEIGDGTLVASLAPFPEDLPGGKQFLLDYKAAGFKDPPDVYGVFGYAAGQTLVELARRFGPDRAAIFQNYRTASDIKTIIGSQSFDADGELQPKKIGISVLEKGEWKKFDASDYKKNFMK
ncbi:MAG: branched-chain amino acid ABC transporter substrate-binding protein [Afipia sp.]|nr:branched-chain amino acid ABC transporter substrate-binding protein [Afipia sp.]